ncbi:MAG: SUMF1/EgtB/PvdO family nonheme iron enzyme [Candidatus Competibacterales bacterium]|nr:SUMF1/EgtB/PvdO family nonheme iron enzyme [Candidatus Competibacterales bacterium]
MLLVLAGLHGLPVHAQGGADGGASAADLEFWEELAFWEAIKDSDDPQEYATYLQLYPQGRFAPLARLRLEELRPPPDAPPGRPFRAANDANVRAAPGIDAPRIDLLRQGDPVEVIGETGDDWYQVRLGDGSIGYVYAGLLEPAEAGGTSAAGPSSATGAAGDTGFRDCPRCPLMVEIPAGSFQMGSAEHRSDEQPVHEVTIPRPFALGVYELTRDEWLACVEDGGCAGYRPAGGDDPALPVSDISWDDAQRYVDWLSRRTGAEYRLPSEAEWEYAAAAGATTDYWWGDQPGNGRANCQGCGSRWDDRQPAPVGSFEPNPFGLYDVHGNLWEWVQDCWHPSYRGAPADGSARDDGFCLSRVLRGGAYKLGPEYMRLTRRFNYDRDVRYYLNGLRVARTLP